MNYIPLLFAFLCCSAPLLNSESNAQESFIVETNQKIERNEKKYSEIQEDLICALEECLRSSVSLLERIATLQQKTLDELRKTVENMPKMSRSHIKKELKRVENLCQTLKSTNFA